MRFQKEAWECYSVLQNQAKRVERKSAANGAFIALPVLQNILDQTKVAGEVDLGVVNIPVNQIVGIASECDRDIYTSDFLPLPSVSSGFAEKWTQLFVAHLSGTGLAEPIRCYEYLGKFYVVDGKKRVGSVKANGTIAELRNMPSWTLAELMKESWLDMCKISNPNFKIHMSTVQKAS